MKKKAAALKYNEKYNVPIVTAIGFGQIAEKIISVAKESNIPIVENDTLTDNISKLPLGEGIPPDLYEAVAKVIAYIYSLNDTKGE